MRRQVDIFQFSDEFQLHFYYQINWGHLLTWRKNFLIRNSYAYQAVTLCYADETGVHYFHVTATRSLFIENSLENFEV